MSSRIMSMASTVSIYFMSSVLVEPSTVVREFTSTPTRTWSSTLMRMNLPLPTAASGSSGVSTLVRLAHRALVAPRSTLQAASRPARLGVYFSPVCLPRSSAKTTLALVRLTMCIQSGAEAL